MARHGRWFVPGVPQHIIQRGNNRQAVFFGESDYRAYLDWLAEIAADRGLSIHAYVLMPNHVHLLATPKAEDSIPATMQTLGRLYVRRINQMLGRTGSLWEGRYRATVIDSEAYLLRCMRYIELNPVRGKLASKPDGYRWSSYLANAKGRTDALITPHKLFHVFGREAYRALVQDGLSAEELESIRRTVNSGWPLGGDSFRATVARIAKRPAAPAKPGPKTNSGSELKP
ncbi:MAG: transposase [Alphaproteobacteria bacterium]|nr:transposase [Alphaproteobacteria bacterium]